MPIGCYIILVMLHAHATILFLALLGLYCQQVANGYESGFGFSVPHDKSNNEFPLLPMVSFIAKKHILLLHAGGDSKRVPWANPMGKVFLPLPYLASEDPDGPVPLLFDHILAISSCARQAFENEGYLSFLPFEYLTFGHKWNLKGYRSVT